MRSSPLLLGSFSLDLFVVLLGGAVALMPIFASDHLWVRAGWALRAAPADRRVHDVTGHGALSESQQAGARLLICVAILMVTVVFGLSRNLWCSLAALAVSGAADVDQRDHSRIAAAACNSAADARQVAL